VHDPNPAAVSISAPPPPKPAPETVWSKPGATDEDFQRTRAACLLRQMEAENANPNSWGWIMVFSLCMRASGWVHIPKI
jgi:hypothetical protein